MKIENYIEEKPLTVTDLIRSLKRGQRIVFEKGEGAPTMRAIVSRVAGETGRKFRTEHDGERWIVSRLQ